MVKLSVGNIYTKISIDYLPDQQDLINISDILVYDDPSARHTKLYQYGRWDGKVRLLDMESQTFRTGLLERVRMYNPEIPIVDNRRKLATKLDLLFTDKITPKPFQKEVLTHIDQNDIGIIVSKTGTGKSLMAGLIIAHINQPTMVLVTDLVLMEQMRQNLRQYLNTDIGIIGDSEFDLKNVTVSTYQSLRSILAGKKISENRQALSAHLDTISVVISDEAHLFDSDSTAIILPFFKHAHRFYGLSATPYGINDDGELLENLELEQHFGKVIYDTRKIDTSDLRVPLVIRLEERIPVNKRYITHKKKMRGKSVLDHSKNYKEAIDTEIVNNLEYHKYIANIATELVTGGMSVFIHAYHSVAFGESIQKLIRGAELVNGSTPRAERNRIYSDIAAKRSMVLISDIGGVGLDIPSLNAIILASDIKDVRQLIGRVVRKSPGKDYGLVIDIRIPTTFIGKHRDIRMLQYELENANVYSS